MSTKMKNESVFEIEIGNTEFICSMQDVNGVPVLNLDNTEGGYVFLKKYKESRWARFAKWVDKTIFRNETSFLPTQWVDISWFKENKHLVRSYSFVAVGKKGTKETLAAYAASLGMLYCFLKKENAVNAMPDFIQVHFLSVFGNKSFIYRKIQDREMEDDVISSFVVCKSMAEKQAMRMDNSSLH